MEFEDWMLSQGLSLSSIKKYSGAIDGALTTWGGLHADSMKRIRTIRDPQEFAALVELIEGTDIFTERNARGNHMYSSALNNYARYLQALAVGVDAEVSSGPFTRELTEFAACEGELAQFELKGQSDARERVLRAVVRRQGQPQFRTELIRAYEGRCAITQCSLLVTLEAAHITPYLGPDTNLVSNGLLLRADIHTLWDLGLLAINPTTMLVAVSPDAHDVTYQELSGSRVFQPIEPSSRASRAALNQQWEIFHSHQTG